MRNRALVAALAVVAAVVLAIVVGGDRVRTGASGTTAAATATAPVVPPVDAGWSERGMNVTAYQPQVFASDAAGAQLDAIKTTGTTQIGIVVTWYQPNRTANAVAPDPAKSATDDDVRALASAAKARGMTIALKPQVDVLDGTFRGDIAPSDPSAWMRSYGDFVNHIADLATETGATTLVVGTELSSLSGRTDDWRALIGQVRGKFTGTLTYGANWVDEAERIGFWDALDIIGVDAYMPLSKNDPNPPIADLVKGWQPWKQRLDTLRQKINKAVLFTELGYPSRLCAAQRPSQEGSGAVSQEAQRRAYVAAFRAWKGVTWFHGVWWWDWPAAGPDPTLDAGSYTPAGKTAQAALTEWLTGTKPTAAGPATGATATP